MGNIGVKKMEKKYVGEKSVERIKRLMRKKNAVVLAHNYERPEVLDIADVVGGSSGLVNAAMETSADIIVVCGVDFMAETVAILNPDKKVIFPDRGARCPMAQELSRAELLKAKRENPDAKVLLYMNSLAETKALADCICTSSNAVKLAETMDGGSSILFGPDRGLAYYVSKRTSKKIIPFPEYGICPVHYQISLEDMIEAKEAHPGAKIVGHPECTPEVQDFTDYLGSTTGIVRFCKEAEGDEFLVAAEVGLMHMLKKAAPDKIFYPVSNTTICTLMKMATLSKIEKALETEKYEVVIPREIAVAARRPIERMLELS
jgi:quinolinate synthase